MTSGASRFLASRQARLGGGLVAALGAFSLLVPLFARQGAYASDFVTGLAAEGVPAGPSLAHPLGADLLYRDEMVRAACAGRISILIAVAATALASALGAAVGIVAGWTEGRRIQVPWTAIAGTAGAGVAAAMGHGALAALVFAGAVAVSLRLGAGPHLDVDGALMRLVDVMLAFPFVLLVMAIGAALDRTNAVTIFVTLGATGWVGIARVLRSKTLQVRAAEYIEASRALGQSTAVILLRHVLPNVAGTLVVTATVQVAQMIVADSVLSYLGVGISPPTPTWGRMLFDGQDHYAAAPWLVAVPGAAIVLAVWGFNMLGEGLRDALDPRDR
ncbi:MAG TPA: ABC transporter permease [Polyangiaceae bacterium]|jgi:ABC-type dipeptide/oligopeptide/nickel transport system permease subunit|nr:ABC transporter permease [Polyangiaceae bacterium]